jgi:hypothetical protein
MPYVPPIPDTSCESYGLNNRMYALLETSVSGGYSGEEHGLLATARRTQIRCECVHAV